MKKANPTVIGGFVVGGITLAVAAVILISSGTLFQKKETFVLFYDGSVAGLQQGSPVKFRGVEVGAVKHIYLDLGDGRPSEDNSIPVVLDIYEDRIRDRGGVVSLDDPEWIQWAIEGGLRAQLLTESLLTGRLYVALDLYPESPLVLRGGPENPYPEIPTLPTAFEEIQQKLTEFVGELQTVELDSISRSFTDLMQSMNDLVSSPSLIAAVESLDSTLANTNDAINDLQALMHEIDTEVVPTVAGLDTVRVRAAAAMQETEATMASLRVLLEPGSPIAYRLEATLKELAAASRAMQALVDYLERNPGALIRGREAKEENQ